MPVIINGSTGITNVNGSASTPAETGTDTDTGIYYGTNTVGLATNGTNALFIDSSQNVGIGTTNTTDQRLKVKQSADTGASSFSFKVEANANDTGLYIGYRGAGAATAADTCAITATYNSTGAFKPITFLTSDAERMRIDSSGNVGIGTSSPGFKLELVNGYNNGLNIKDSTGTVFGGMFVESGQFAVRSRSNHPLVFSTNDVIRATIDTSGNLLVGTTSALVTPARIAVVFSGDTTWGIGFKSTYASGAGQPCTFINTSNAVIGYIGTSGTATSYNTSSDYRLKHNIAPMTGALAKVSALKPVTYKWKSDDSECEGFIAHELAEVCPHAVTGEKDAVDENGNIKPQGIDTSFLVATLTAAIQEQQALITALTARIESLETK